MPSLPPCVYHLPVVDWHQVHSWRRVLLGRALELLGPLLDVPLLLARLVWPGWSYPLFLLTPSNRSGSAISLKCKCFSSA